MITNQVEIQESYRARDTQKKGRNWSRSGEVPGPAQPQRNMTRILTFSPSPDALALAMPSHGSGGSHFTEIFRNTSGDGRGLSLQLPEGPNTRHLVLLWRGCWLQVWVCWAVCHLP